MSAGDMAALEQTALAGIELDSRAIENYHEARLIERLRARELGAFEDLLAHFERPVYSLCSIAWRRRRGARRGAGDFLEGLSRAFGLSRRGGA